MLETPSIPHYSPRFRGSENVTGADNQQERLAFGRESSETIRQTSVSRMMRWSPLHGDMQGRRFQGRRCPPETCSGKTRSEIPCRVTGLPEPEVIPVDKPANNGEALL